MNAPPHFRTVGECAFLLELQSLAEVTGTAAWLRQQQPAGVVDVVAGACTVFLKCDSPDSARRVRLLLAGAELSQLQPAPGAVHTLETVYDGADLATAARLAGLSAGALVAWHSGQEWVAAFGGFAPGFMYLSPLSGALGIPRRSTPRTAVPAGSVAVGGEFSAVYPGPTPGGWQLLGRCAEILWDTARPQPALIEPGDRVRFKPVREVLRLDQPSVRGHVDSAQPTPERFGLAVRAAGVFTTVQDFGRPGSAHLGVGASGALDRPALRRANRMVGNLPATGAAGLELVRSGLRVQAHGPQVLAVAGNSVRLTICSGTGAERGAPVDTAIALEDGEVLAVHAAPAGTGFRSVLAVRGGVAAVPVLGSRATDVLSGLGPPPLRAGAFVPVGQTAAVGPVGFPEPSAPPSGEAAVLRFTLGPRDEWFTPQSLRDFTQRTWHVGSQSNRVGLRLEGAGAAPLQRTRATRGLELPSEGMADGAIQVPPSGLPVLFLADHPVTGGYPVLGVVLAEDLATAAALGPGAAVRFCLAEPNTSRVDGPPTPQ